MLSYSQTGTDPFVIEAEGSSPTGIAKLLALIGIAPVLIGALVMFGSGGEGEAAGLGISLLMLGGVTSLVGLFRLGAEHSARFIVFTQPRRLSLIETGGKLRIEADRHLIPGDSVKRIEVHRMVIPPTTEYGEPEARFFVAIVTRRNLVELQMSSPSDAEHYAKVLAHRLDVPVSGRDRPMLPQAIGFGGMYLILALFAIMGASFWSMMDSGDLMIGVGAVVAIVLLQYPVVRLTMVATVRRWMQRTYGIKT